MYSHISEYLPVLISDWLNSCLSIQAAIRLQINLKKSSHEVPPVSKSFIGGCWRDMPWYTDRKNYLPLSPGERSPFSSENVKQTLQTFNPAQPDFNMRQHIARCTLRPSLKVQALKVSPERFFGGGGSPKSNLLKYSCYEEKNACQQWSGAQSACRPTDTPVFRAVEQRGKR